MYRDEKIDSQNILFTANKQNEIIPFIGFDFVNKKEEMLR
jgi:hypothetical protein